MTRRDDCSPPTSAVTAAVRIALAEDLEPLGDITSSLLDPARTARASIVARRAGVIAGSGCVAETCRQVDPALVFRPTRTDGDAVGAGDAVASIEGPFRSLLTAERTALNFLGHLSGVATLTRAYVDVASAANPGVRVLDTRKTTPGLRALEKAAVRAGGGFNHRGNLSEGILIKDNHLGGISIADAVREAKRRWPGRMVEVECDSLDQVEIAVSSGATMVLCDNMTPDELRLAVAIVHAQVASPGTCLVEASGGITLDTIGAYAATGADVISVGALTHSASVLDVGLDLEA